MNQEPSRNNTENPQINRIAPDDRRSGIPLSIVVGSIAVLVVLTLLYFFTVFGDRKPSPTTSNGTLLQTQSAGHEHEDVAPSRAADTLYNESLALQSSGHIAEAIRGYRAVLEIDDNHAETHNNLAAALASQQKIDEATKHFRRVVEIKPDYAEGHFNLGNVIAAQNALEQAIPHYEKAVELKPDYAKAHNNLAVALKHTGQIERAYQHAQEALRLQRGATPSAP